MIFGDNWSYAGRNVEKYWSILIHVIHAAAYYANKNGKKIQKCESSRKSDVNFGYQVFFQCSIICNSLNGGFVVERYIL